MKVEDVKSMMNKDSKIDNSSLDHEALRTPELCSKYNQLLYEERQTLEFMQVEYDIIRMKRWRYYQGKADPEEYEKEPFNHKVLRGDVDIYLKSDLRVIEADQKIVGQKHKIKMIEEFLKDSLCQRSWLIGHAIKWKMLSEGLL